MANAGLGFTGRLCRYHIIHQSIHGSHTVKSLPPRIVHHIRMAAERWIKRHREKPEVQHSLTELSGLYFTVGRKFEKAWDLRLKRPLARAYNIVAKWNATSIERERVLATVIATSIALDLDSQGPHGELYRDVQMAKSLHRLSSGTAIRLSDGSVVARKYPASRGRVLRHLGPLVSQRCLSVLAIKEEVLAEIVARARPPSRLSQSIEFLKAPCVHRFVPGKSGASEYARVRIETASGKPLDAVR